jgi:uncharacterized membrane protein YkoI
MKKITNAVLLSAALAVAGGAAEAKSPAHYAGWRLAASAHITMAQAQQIALKARPGVITDKELEREGGGSGLRYSFDIKAGGKTFEVGVDAQTGKVLENDAEGRNPD